MSSSQLGGAIQLGEHSAPSGALDLELELELKLVPDSDKSKRQQGRKSRVGSRKKQVAVANLRAKSAKSRRTRIRWDIPIGLNYFKHVKAVRLLSLFGLLIRSLGIRNFAPACERIVCSV